MLYAEGSPGSQYTANESVKPMEEYSKYVGIIPPPKYIVMIITIRINFLPAKCLIVTM